MSNILRAMSDGTSYNIIVKPDLLWRRRTCRWSAHVPLYTSNTHILQLIGLSTHNNTINIYNWLDGLGIQPRVVHIIHQFTYINTCNDINVQFIGWARHHILYHRYIDQAMLGPVCACARRLVCTVTISWVYVLYLEYIYYTTVVPIRHSSSGR